MKRIHIHIAVSELSNSIRFYSALFGAAPSVEREDYAKWNLDDPKVNFAISSRGHESGVNHLGIQVESDQELTELAQRLSKAEIAVSEQKGAACCYAESDKHWALDPQGIAWETFHTLGEIPVFGEDIKSAASADATECCIPSNISSTDNKSLACCIPIDNKSGCCS